MAENDQDSEEQPKSSKKLIIIIAVVLLLAGAGAGYYFFFMGDSVEVEAEETEEEEQEEEEKVTDYFYFDIEKPFIAQFPKGSAARLLQVSISVQVKKEDFIEQLKKHQPMIRNNLLMIINDTKPAELKTLEAKQELKNKILDELNSIMNKMSSKNEIQDVFFTALVMQ